MAGVELNLYGADVFWQGKGAEQGDNEAVGFELSRYFHLKGRRDYYEL